MILQPEQSTTDRQLPYQKPFYDVRFEGVGGRRAEALHLAEYQ
jgi:hypothetical protein